MIDATGFDETQLEQLKIQLADSLKKRFVDISIAEGLSREQAEAAATAALSRLNVWGVDEAEQRRSRE